MQHTTQKQLIRAELRLLRKGISTAERHKKSQAVTELLLQLQHFQKAQVIHLYLSYATEVETGSLFSLARRKNKRIVVPVMDISSKSLHFSELNTLRPDILEKGPLGILQPYSNFQKEVDPATIDLWIVPGLGFDPQGNRLGYGGGYYDRVLQRRKTTVVGLAFEIQILPHLPFEETDVPVDYIITEKRTIVCRNKGGSNT